MTAPPLTLDEALRTQCEHGISLVIVCPICNPEKYIISEEETRRLQEKFKEYSVK
jgi:hypothetical protein